MMQGLPFTRGVWSVVFFAIVASMAASGAINPSMLTHCRELAWSTEEDFVTRGPEPPDGNPIISDGDLLGKNCAVCVRNSDLVGVFDVVGDLGLDAVDVLGVDPPLVAFSTELDSPNLGQFTAGDLLFTHGAIIPNQALTDMFSVGFDLGLDAVHIVGPPKSVHAFVDVLAQYPRDFWLREPGALAAMLREYQVDIWFSTEGTAPTPSMPAFLDGDLLSARDGLIVRSNAELLPTGVPAGIPMRGVDFGLDAVAAEREPERIWFSTEILHEGEKRFTAGDIILAGGGIVLRNTELTPCFEPMALYLGLDALSVAETSVTPDCPYRPAMDFNGDCKVALEDFAVFAAQWLTCGLADPGMCWP